MGGIMKNAPNALIWAVCLCFIAVVVAFAVLAATGSDTGDLRAFLATILPIVSVVLSGGALVASGAAAKSAGNAEEQTNGVASTQAETITAYQKENAELRQLLAVHRNMTSGKK
jgi:hypothetical protein